ncbi:MAG TPA: hypothetical protein VJK05_05815 [archaeon]|nr:hypothetical protein [archaeon]
MAKKGHELEGGEQWWVVPILLVLIGAWYLGGFSQLGYWADPPVEIVPLLTFLWGVKKLLMKWM